MTADTTTDHTDRVLLGSFVVVVVLTTRHLWLHLDVIQPYVIGSATTIAIIVVFICVSWIIGYLVFDIPRHVTEWIEHDGDET